MTRKVLMLTAAAAFTAVASFALAAGPNDAVNYPNSATGKTYKDVRNLDHNNPAPRYPVASTAGNTAPANAARIRHVRHASHGRAGSHG
jgi:hypothetical protein